MRKRKRRPFVLLEVLIAFMILVTCVAPLVQGPYKFLKIQSFSVDRAEAARLDTLLFAEVKAQLYKNKIPWETLAQEKVKRPVAPVAYDFPFDALDPKKMVKKPDEPPKIPKFRHLVYFWRENGGKSKQGEELLLVNVRLVFEPLNRPKKEKGRWGKVNVLTFDHKVCVKKAPALAT